MSAHMSPLITQPPAPIHMRRSLGGVSISSVILLLVLFLGGGVVALVSDWEWPFRFGGVVAFLLLSLLVCPFQGQTLGGFLHRASAFYLKRHARFLAERVLPQGRQLRVAASTEDSAGPALVHSLEHEDGDLGDVLAARLARFSAYGVLHNEWPAGEMRHVQPDPRLQHPVPGQFRRLHLPAIAPIPLREATRPVRSTITGTRKPQTTRSLPTNTQNSTAGPVLPSLLQGVGPHDRLLPFHEGFGGPYDPDAAFLLYADRGPASVSLDENKGSTSVSLERNPWKLTSHVRTSRVS
jgi:hypothetical protein